MEKSVVSQKFMHHVLGKVQIIVRSNAVRCTARRKGDILYVTIPPGMSSDSLMSVLDKMTPAIQADDSRRPHYYVGWQCVVDDVVYSVQRGTKPGMLHFDYKSDPKRPTFYLPPSVPDSGSDWADKTIVEMLNDYAKNSILDILDLAYKMISQLNVNPLFVDISYGHSVLGRCSADGRVLLSYMLVFYPRHLQRYIIAHEYAHLRHLNHSPDFYRLLDKYMDGHGDEYREMLRNYRPPYRIPAPTDK